MTFLTPDALTGHQVFSQGNCERFRKMFGLVLQFVTSRTMSKDQVRIQSPDFAKTQSQLLQSRLKFTQELNPSIVRI